MMWFTVFRCLQQECFLAENNISHRPLQWIYSDRHIFSQKLRLEQVTHTILSQKTKQDMMRQNATTLGEIELRPSVQL
jgi:hypothetical protein